MNSIKAIEKDEFVKVIKKAKKQSTSSIFSGRTYTIYKYTINSERMLYILIKLYSMLVKEKYFLLR